MISFLDLPPELRLPIYTLVLENHTIIRNNRQPNNGHLRLLHTCRTIYHEAHSTIRTYVSLAYERQINNFIRCVDPEERACILWADVANDGRYLSNPRAGSNQHHSGKHDGEDLETAGRPVSNLHIALRGMTSLRRLRAFDCRQGAPAALRSGWSLTLQFEACLFPEIQPSHLTSYELYLDPTTQASLFKTVPTESLKELRLSGDCRLPKANPAQALRSLNLHAITSNHFDIHPIDTTFTDCRLESFVYRMGHRMGFEMRDQHLQSLVKPDSIGSHLRTLVLLECKRFTTAVLSECLSQLKQLEYFALSMITHNELRTNFVTALAKSIKTVKLHVVEGLSPLIEGENALCDALEEMMWKEDPPLEVIRVNFRESIMTEGDRSTRWKDIATQRNIDLKWGSWEKKEKV